MLEVGNLVIINRLFCEDIRQEKSDKLFLIGVFGSDILVSQVPARILSAVYMDGYIKEAGQTHLYIRYSGPGEGEVVIEADFETKTNNQRVTMPIPRMDLLLECEGTFRVDISPDNATWTSVIEKQVILREGLSGPFSIAPQPQLEQSQPDSPAS